jgi:hypothetical protein
MINGRNRQIEKHNGADDQDLTKRPTPVPIAARRRVRHPTGSLP